MEIDTAKPNNPTPPSENVAGFKLTLLFSNSRYLTDSGDLFAAEEELC